MPRDRPPGAPPPKTRSRTGCWPCKHRKVKCGEEKPGCLNCQRNKEQCDYRIHLNWDGRKSKRKDEHNTQTPKNGTSKSDRPTSSSGKEHKEGTVTGSQLAQHWNRSGRYSPDLSFGSHGSIQTGNFSEGPYFKSANARGQSTEDPGYNEYTSIDHLPPLQPRRLEPYPSPTNSNLESPPTTSPAPTSFSTVRQSPAFSEMPPPHQGYTYASSTTSCLVSTPIQASFADHRSKRARVNPSRNASGMFQMYSPPYPNSRGTFVVPSAQTSPQIAPNQTFSPSDSNTLIVTTPAASSITSEDSYQTRARSSLSSQTDESRRISVGSLMSNPESSNDVPFPGILNPSSNFGFGRTSYGTDYGEPDLDLGNNDDTNALNTARLPSVTAIPEWVREDPDDDDTSSEFGFGLDAANEAEDQKTYYAKPVAVNISKGLGQLPDQLLQNPMDMLYFHHFLNHTARILVPHDCSENPFRNILPQMAVNDGNLLQLLLAYSACHRAKLLNHAEPMARISHYVKGVFSTLETALYQSSNPNSNINLATTIMLASLEVISPSTFHVEISWHNHLRTSRSIILRRQRDNPIKRDDVTSYFLMRWFAYLDVLGGLSGGKKAEPPLLHGMYWTTDSDDDYTVDCLLGFTSRCVSILANVATLACQCDYERIDTSTDPATIRLEWRPSEETVAHAERLKKELEEGRNHQFRGCPHRRSSSQFDISCDLVLASTNDAFHHAGLIHLNRRILGRPTNNLEVQHSVKEIVAALSKVRKGGTAEACLLFPMFSAGCDAHEEMQRRIVLERVRSVERSGMVQVKRARQLIERVWETGMAWETLAQDQFLG